MLNTSKLVLHVGLYSLNVGRVDQRYPIGIFHRPDPAIGSCRVVSGRWLLALRVSQGAVGEQAATWRPTLGSAKLKLSGIIKEEFVNIIILLQSCLFRPITKTHFSLLNKVYKTDTDLSRGFSRRLICLCSNEAIKLSTT